MPSPMSGYGNDLRKFGALLLAGGNPQRMGRDKALLHYRGTPLIEHMYSLLTDIGAADIVIGGRPSGLQDVVQGAGPVSSVCALGQYLAAEGGPETWLLVPVDMPLLSEGLLRHLLDQPGAAHFVGNPLPAVLSFDDNLHAFLEVAERDLKAGRRVPVKRLLAAVNGAAIMPEPEEAQQLLNINTPEEWAALLKLERNLC